MKRFIAWIIVLAALVGVGLGVNRSLEKRKVQQAQLAVQIAERAQTVIELGAADVVTLETRTLQRSLPVSGTLRALHTTQVKARVPGIVQDLRVREGDTVEAGQVIARIDPEEYEERLRQARLTAQAARTQIAIAQRQYDSNKALAEKGFIAGTALDTSRDSLEAARANYQAALAAANIAQKSLDDTILRAPMSGQISQRLVQPGERVSVEARIVEVVDLSQLEIEATLSASDAAQVKPGQRASLLVEGFKDVIPARVTRINPSVQAGSRSVLVYLQISNNAGLRQGLYAQGLLYTGQVQTAALPLSAVRNDKPLPYVQVIDGDKIRHVTVKLGERGQLASDQADWYVAIEGSGQTLPPGTQVLSGNAGVLREGTQIKKTQ